MGPLDLTQSSQPPPRGSFWGLRLRDMPREHLAPNAVSTSPSNETRAGQSAALVVDVVGRWTGAVGTWLVCKIVRVDRLELGGTPLNLVLEAAAGLLDLAPQRWPAQPRRGAGSAQLFCPTGACFESCAGFLTSFNGPWTHRVLTWGQGVGMKGASHGPTPFFYW